MANGVGSFGRTQAGLAGLFGGLQQALQLIFTMQQAQEQLDLREREQEQGQRRFDAQLGFDRERAAAEDRRFQDQQRQLRAITAQERSDRAAQQFVDQQQRFGIAADPSAVRQTTTITPSGPLQGGLGPIPGIQSAVGRVAAGEQARQQFAQGFGERSAAARTQAQRTKAAIPFEGGVAFPNFPTESVNTSLGGSQSGSIGGDDLLRFTQQITDTYTTGLNRRLNDEAETQFNFGTQPGDPAYQAAMNKAKEQYDQFFADFMLRLQNSGVLPPGLLNVVQGFGQPAAPPPSRTLSPEDYWRLYTEGAPGGPGGGAPGQGFRQFFPGGGRP